MITISSHNQSAINATDFTQCVLLHKENDSVNTHKQPNLSQGPVPVYQPILSQGPVPVYQPILSQGPVPTYHIISKRNKKI